MTLALIVLAFSGTEGLSIPISIIAEKQRFDRMTKVTTQIFQSKCSQIKASQKEIDQALRSVMNPQQYIDFLAISKARKEEQSTGSRSRSNTDGTHDPGWNNSPEAIRLRLMAEAIAGRSRE